MIRSFAHFQVITEANTYPLEQWMRSHVSSWLNTYSGQLAKLLMRSFGLKLTQRKSDVMSITPDMVHLCNEIGVEVLQDVEGLEIWLRNIFHDGNVWVQIGGIRAGSMAGICSGQMEDNKPNFHVVKNMEEVAKVVNRVKELYSDQDKKGYNKEFKQVAKELNFKIEWDLSEIDKLSKAILKGLKPASEKYAEYLKKYS